jgi:transglutaminase-like putative cysteine protease
MHGYLPLPTAPAPSAALAEWARANAVLPASVKKSCAALAERMRAAFEYRPGSTEYSTPLEEVIAQKAGVCQDFARLFVAACRFYGVPARYVSGYLLPTHDPDEHATHAWAEAWDPEKGWLTFDPTNPGAPRERYVPLGAAAEPSGAAPARGVYRGPSKEKLEVEVKVESA